MKCPKCGAHNSPRNKNCNECGAKMKEVPEHIKEICRKCPDVDCPFDVCYSPNKERGF